MLKNRARMRRRMSLCPPSVGLPNKVDHEFLYAFTLCCPQATSTISACPLQRTSLGLMIFVVGSPDRDQAAPGRHRNSRTGRKNLHGPWLRHHATLHCANGTECSANFNGWSEEGGCWWYVTANLVDRSELEDRAKNTLLYVPYSGVCILEL